jgi:predicted nucleic acid-binding protein
MKRIVIDTNVVISFLTDRDLRQQQMAGKLFEDAASARLEVVLHQAVITEVIYVLQNLYKQAPAAVAATIRDLMDMPGVVVIDEVPWSRLFEIWPGKIETYADAALAAVAASGGHEYLATFDRRFRKHLKRLGIRPYPPAE